MSQIYDTRIKMKKDTEDNWTQSDPLLLDGELILVNTSDGKTKIKIGNGTDTYTNLSFLTLENESSQQDNCPFPINSLFIGADATNPSTYWPSTTWELFGQGKTLVGVDGEDTDFNAVEKIGGKKLVTSSSHTHTTSSHQLTTSELPSHNHSIGSHSHTMNHTHNDTFRVSSHSHSMTHDHQLAGYTAYSEIQSGIFYQPMRHGTSMPISLDHDTSTSTFDGYSIPFEKNKVPANNIGTTGVRHQHSLAGIHTSEYDGSTSSASPSLSGSVSSYSGSTGSASGTTSSVGSGNAHNHGDTGNATVTVNTLQPYITVYMWKRTA